MSTADDILDGKTSKSAVDTILDGPPIAGAREQPFDTSQMSELGITPESAMQLAKSIPGALPTVGEAAGQGFGALGGGAVGGVPGAVGGALVGGPIGRELGYGAARLFGVPDTRTTSQQLQEDAASALMSGVGQTAGPALGYVGRTGLKLLGRGDNTAADVANALADANQWGVTPPIKPVALNYSAKKVSEKIAAETAARVKALSERGISEGVTGAAGVSDVATGAAIKLGAEQGANRFNDTAQALYGKFDKLLPGETKTTFENFRDTLAELTTPTQGAEASTASLISPRAKQFAAGVAEDIKNSTEVAKAANGELQPLLRFDALRAIRSKIGAEIGNPGIGPDSIPIGALKQMYTALSADMRIAAQTMKNPETLKAFDRADKFYKNGIDDIEKNIKPLVEGKLEQDVAAVTRDSANAGPQQIASLREKLTPAQWKLVAANAMQNLTSDTKGTIQGMAQEFNFPAFVQKWKDLPDDSKEALFGNMNGLRESLDTLARVSKRISDVAGTAQHSYSLLAHPLMFPALAAGGAAGGTLLGGGSVGSAAGAAGAAMLAMNTIPKAAGKLMTNPAVVRWLAQGTKVAPNGAGAWIGRLSAIAADADPGTRGAIQELLGGMQTQGSQ